MLSIILKCFSLLDKNLTMADIERSFGSNTCRCTGYRPILDTMKTFAIDTLPHILENIIDIEELSNIQSCSRSCSVKSEGSDWSIINNNANEKLNVVEVSYDNHIKFFKVFVVKDIFDVLDKVGYDSYMLIAGNTGKGNILCTDAIHLYSYDENVSGYRILKSGFKTQHHNATCSI